MDAQLQTIAFALGAMWAGFGTAMTSYFRLYETRDRVLDWNEPDTKLTADQKAFLIQWDYCAVLWSLFTFIAILTMGEFFLAWYSFGKNWVGAGCGCVVIAIFGLAGMGINLFVGLKTTKMMRENISEMRKQSTT